jgi:hypothetical protein
MAQTLSLALSPQRVAVVEDLLIRHSTQLEMLDEVVALAVVKREELQVKQELAQEMLADIVQSRAMRVELEIVVLLIMAQVVAVEQVQLVSTEPQHQVVLVVLALLHPSQVHL